MRHARRRPADRMLAARLGDERGSASLEFVTVGVLMLIPLVYLVLALASIQGGALAVEGAARQAARVFVEAPDEATARSRSASAVAIALADYGLRAGEARVTISCRPDPARCLHRGSVITATVRTSVPLPLVPDILELSRGASVPVESTARQRVSRFWGGS